MNLETLDKISLNFIVGSGRSGTTLLVYIFNQNKYCVASPEIKHFLHFYKKYKNVTHVTQKLIDDYGLYLKTYYQDKKLFMSPNADAALKMLKIGSEINYTRLTKLIYFCLTEEKQDIHRINVIIDKNPYYTFYLKKIMSYFPDSKVVFMVRDYRAFILSNRQSQKKNMKILSVSYYALIWNLFLKKAIRAQKEHAKRLIFVKYEDLVTAKEETVEIIANYFNLSYSLEMLNFYETIKESLKDKQLSNIQLERAIKKISDLSKPINTSRLNAWQSELQPSEQKIANFICGNYATQVGYQNQRFNFSISFKFYVYILSLPARIRICIFLIFDNPKLKFYFDTRKIK